jgi:AraC family transcriptional regulator
MSDELSIKLLLDTETVALRDVVCRGDCRHKSAEECAQSTYLVFPYQGVFVRHLGSGEVVGEANQVMLFNQDETYRVSHPVKGGDACLSIATDEALLRELTPKEHVRGGAVLAFHQQRLRIDARAQALVALLRHGLQREVIETLEAEVLALTLVKRALGERTAHVIRASAGRRKLVDRAKLTLTSDLGRRWKLAQIAAEVGVSPVYLTQVFQQVEGMPLYRYQLRLRLARALDLLPEVADLTTLSMELGFSSHSHFSSAFRQAYGRTPKEFQQLVRRR